MTLTATQSGSFDDGATWGGTIPSGACYIIIPAGITVTFTGTKLNIYVITLTIDGTFQVVSTGGIGFTFGYSINILVRSGGVFADQTDTHIIFCRRDSVLTFLPGASFIGSNTQITAYTIFFLFPVNGLSYTLGSSIAGPFTLGILLDGTLKNFNSVMCIVRQSGSWSNDVTWLGGIAPTVDFCGSAGGCDLFIPTGLTVSTASLNGVLDILFNEMTVSLGSSLRLGTPNSNTGFRFSFAVKLNVYGWVSDVTDGTGGILFPGGSYFSFFPGGYFTSLFATFIQIYDTNSGQAVGEAFSLLTIFFGPYFIQIPTTGSITWSYQRTYLSSISVMKEIYTNDHRQMKRMRKLDE